MGPPRQADETDHLSAPPDPSPPRTRRLRAHGPAVLAYVLLVAVALWPTVRHFRTRFLLPSGDGQVFVWSWWALPRAIGDGRNPFTTTDLFHPVGADLSLTTTAPLLALLLWPVRAMLGPAAQVNAAQLGATFLTATLTYALALRATRSRGAAWLAGAAFTFAPYRFIHIDHLNLVNTWTIPLAILAFLRFVDAPGRARALALGGSIGLAFLVDPQLAVLATVTVAVLAFVHLRVVAGAWRRLVVAALTALVVATPLLVPMVLALRGGEADPVAGLGGSWYYSSDVLSWVVPPRGNPLFGKTLGDYQPATKEGQAYPGLVLLGLAMFGRGVVERSRRRPWVALGFASFVLSLGPFLHVGGWSGTLFSYDGQRFAVPMPFLAFHLVPGLDSLRVPGRFLIPGVLAVGLLAAQVLGSVAAPWRRRGGLALVAILTAVELLPGPLRTLPAQAPQPYHAIAEDPDQGAVLELPLQWLTGTDVVGDMAAERDNSLLLGFATVHQRPLVSGSVSSYPRSRLDRLTGDPLYRQILALEDEPGYTDVPRFGAQELRSAGISFVVHHRDRPLPRAEEYLASLGMPVLADDGTVRVWKVPETPVPSPTGERPAP
jgi:hypothetical protein